MKVSILKKSRKSEKSALVNFFLILMLQNILLSVADAAILNRTNLRRGLTDEIRKLTNSPNDAAQISGIHALPKNFENERDKEDRNRLHELARRRHPSRKQQPKLPHENHVTEKSRKRSTKINTRKNRKQRRIRMN